MEEGGEEEMGWEQEREWGGKGRQIGEEGAEEGAEGEWERTV